MNHLITPKPSNWLLAPALVALLAMILAAVWAGCSGTSTQVKVENPTELCAQAVAMSSEVRSQAAKIGLEPIELARKTCEAAILAAKLAEANLVKASGGAGAPALLLPNYSNAAGAGGVGG